MYIYNGHKGKEYIIVENTSNFGWCLLRLAGYNMEQAQETLEQCQQEFPDKELKIEETKYEENWWNLYTD